MFNLFKVVILIFSLTVGENSFSQGKGFTFGSPGNPCYFEYLCYAPNDIYNNVKRPFIFILANENQTIADLYIEDTLKNVSQFYNYMFVYLPNLGGSMNKKLYCIDALVSMKTSGYSGGRENVFFSIHDTKIKPLEYEKHDVNSLFEKTIFAKSIIKDTLSITHAFKETIVKTEESKEDFASYYIEETSKNDKQQEKEVVNVTKTYFGAPIKHDYTLTGVVRDKVTGENLPFAMVLVKGTSIGTTTNMDGFFSIPKVPSDTSTIIVKYVGFNPTLLFLTPALPSKNITIHLASTSTNLEAVTVLGMKQDVVLSDNKSISKIKITPAKLAKLPSLGERDVMRSFQLMPGVSSSNESSSGLYVRGGTPDQNLVLYDGFTVYHVDHLYGFFSAFNANAIKEVQLYKGGFESRFGGRLSSVSEITGKNGNRNKFNLGADVSLLSTNVFAEIPIGDKFTSIFTFRKSYQGFIYNTIFDKFNESDEDVQNAPGGGPGGPTREVDVTSYFYDFNGKMSYKLSSKDILSLSFYSGTDKLDNSSSLSAPSFGGNSNFSSNSTDLTKYGNIGSSLKWARSWTDKIYGNTVLSFSNYYSDRNQTEERTTENDAGETVVTNRGVIEENDLKDFSLRSDYQWNLGNHNQLEFGLFSTYYDIDYTYAQSDTVTILNKSNKALLSGIYVQNKFKFLKDKIEFMPGLRSSFFSTTNEVYFEPRASLTVELSKRWSVLGSFGKYYQFANRVTREDILSGSKDFWLLSDDESVPVSSSLHYIGGFSYNLPKYVFSVEGYYKNVYDITEYSLRFNPSPNGISYDENFFSGKGYAKGIEFLAQKKGGKLNGWISYTLAEAKNNFEIYSNEYYSANQDVTHEFKIVSMFNHKRWDFSATWVYATGRPYTAPSGAYSIDLLDGSTQDFFTVTNKNTIRLPSYHRADFSVTYKLLAGLKGEKKRRDIGYIGFSIFNVYNRTNVWYKEYLIEEGDIIETDANYLGITPNLTLSLKIR
jgi:hypothetical protein